ncbi:MAG: homeodomain transcription factor ste12 [Vezdaea aestivalis]|nr:MAG: homeodomain transcription factor ste12 [Vezdaea aestivalis]
MYTQPHAGMPPPQKPETFMLSNEAQQSLPHDAQVALHQVDNLKYFLISAPVDWIPDQYIRRFLLPTGEYVSCVLWNNLFHISGTDIVRCLSFRFQAFGRPVNNTKKFEEGIFSDLRNLKSGTDASLEEPKSSFLDFLYKNNCIRTQKKQKVFYWYSVPHDRLFLDALERDLKREKMGQEATTRAVNEPALSFEFDSSQSLFEQLTKAQQANTSSFTANAATTYSQSASPIMRASDSMPPPQIIPNQITMSATSNPMSAVSNQMSAISNPMSNTMTAVTDDIAQSSYAAQMAMGQNGMKRDQDYSTMQPYDRNGLPIARNHQRHASMPAYMEYASPAPSFVSSHWNEFGSERAISYEPITPPQAGSNIGPEPAYIHNEDSGIYSTIPDVNSGRDSYGVMHMPPSNITGAQYSGSSARGYGSNNVYSVMEGSPTYKQRRRRSSLTPGIQAATAATAAASGTAHPPHRPSELRRSMSSSVQPQTEEEEHNSPPGLTNSYGMMSKHQELMELSRHGTPLQTLEGSPAPNPLLVQHQESVGDDDLHERRSGVPGVMRRARSATVMELSPYPQKQHSCPIPTCGRLFKRLEHLKRHVRTHTQERPYICEHCNKRFSRSDNLAQHRRIHESKDPNAPEAYGAYEDEELDEPGEDQLPPLEEASPGSDHQIHHQQAVQYSAAAAGMATGNPLVMGQGQSQSMGMHVGVGGAQMMPQQI